MGIPYSALRRLRELPDPEEIVKEGEIPVFAPSDTFGMGDVPVWDGEKFVGGEAGSGGSGPAGPQGPQGDPGADGADGPAGPAGPQGDPGADGAAGADGADGAAGPQGPRGYQGDAGAAGAAGAAGPAGPQGDVGAQGPQGDPGGGEGGGTGPQGPQGDVGAAGPQGPQGDVGAAGGQGPQGADGVAGAQGAQGGAAGSYSTYKKISLLTGPQGYWPMDDLAANKVTDLEAGAQPTAPGGVTQDTAGNGPPVGGAGVIFDGTQTGFNIASNFGLGNADWTIACWVFVPSGGMRGECLKVGNASDGFGIGVGSGGNYESSGLRVYALFEGVRWIDSGFDVVANAWNHIAVLANHGVGGEDQVWVNKNHKYEMGISVGTIAKVPGANTYIGGSPTASARKLTNGVKIAHALIASRALDKYELSVLRRWRPT